MENLKVVQLDFGFGCKPELGKKKTLKPNKKTSDDFYFRYYGLHRQPYHRF